MAPEGASNDGQIEATGSADRDESTIAQREAKNRVKQAVEHVRSWLAGDGTTEARAAADQPGGSASGGTGSGDSAAGGRAGEPNRFSRQAGRLAGLGNQSAAFARRGWVACYAATTSSVAVSELNTKLRKVDVNYRPYAGGGRCGTCEHFRNGLCAVVAGDIRAEDFCDLWQPTADPDRVSTRTDADWTAGVPPQSHSAVGRRTGFLSRAKLSAVGRPESLGRPPQSERHAESAIGGPCASQRQ